MRRTTTARRGLAAAALALTLGLSLAACSGDAGADPSASPSASSTSAASAADTAALAKVTVEGDAGAKPTVTLPSTPFTVTSLVARVVDEGTGAEITEGQTVSVHELAVSGTDGSAIGDTYSGTPESIVADDQLAPPLHDVLVGQKVGVRILIAAPGDSGTNVYFAEVVDAKDTPPVPARAEGEAVTPPAGLPTVTLDADGKPSITPLTTAAPTTLVSQTLIKGAGAPVTADQTLTVNYTGWLWDGTQFDSSWDTGDHATFALSGVIPGWTQGLTGQTVGSQVLLIIPPDLGYGATASGKIPANSTLVFVVDILAAS
ncbi:FKBP-type peptidyl-prolyl cis-trans isomerase [Cellulomonas sp. ICMP 17802]|uniref:FKBP-type peptidyl-prolyl cis-trans isomerase n=1 Tax=Cellulomonas sp. ICMP 17802 TaxID=3239199 RepID=UPI00351B470B